MSKSIEEKYIELADNYGVDVSVPANFIESQKLLLIEMMRHMQRLDDMAYNPRMIMNGDGSITPLIVKRTARNERETDCDFELVDVPGEINKIIDTLEEIDNEAYHDSVVKGDVSVREHITGRGDNEPLIVPALFKHDFYIKPEDMSEEVWREQHEGKFVTEECDLIKDDKYIICMKHNESWVEGVDAVPESCSKSDYNKLLQMNTEPMKGMTNSFSAEIDPNACWAVQHSCQMVCERCGLTWDMNDPEPPACKPKYISALDEELNKPLVLSDEQLAEANIELNKQLFTCGDCKHRDTIICPEYSTCTMPLDINKACESFEHKP